MNAVAMLPAADLSRVAKLLALSASEFDGEALAAVRAANVIMRRHALTWSEILAPQATMPRGVDPEETTGPQFRSVARQCLMRAELLTPREANFLASLLRFPRISEKQQSWLDAIANRVLGGRR